MISLLSHFLVRASNVIIEKWWKARGQQFLVPFVDGAGQIWRFSIVFNWPLISLPYHFGRRYANWRQEWVPDCRSHLRETGWRARCTLWMKLFWGRLGPRLARSRADPCQRTGKSKPFVCWITLLAFQRVFVKELLRNGEMCYSTRFWAFHKRAFQKRA